MDVWLVTETTNDGYKYILRAAASIESAKKVAELDYHEHVDGELDWHDMETGASYAKVGHVYYQVARMEVME